MEIENCCTLGIKSKLKEEYRRFSLPKDDFCHFLTFVDLLIDIHRLKQYSELRISDPIVETNVPFTIWYWDNLDDKKKEIFDTHTLGKAVGQSQKFLKILLILKNDDTSKEENFNVNYIKEKKQSLGILFKTVLRPRSEKKHFKLTSYSYGDLTKEKYIPKCTKKVPIQRMNQNMPLGLYIRYAIGAEKYGVLKDYVFISKITSSSIASECGELKVGDCIMQVNGACVKDKSLSQVSEMICANKNKLVFTIFEFPQKSEKKVKHSWFSFGGGSVNKNDISVKTSSSTTTTESDLDTYSLSTPSLFPRKLNNSYN